MVITAIHIYRYMLPFKEPLALGGRILPAREGLVVEALDEDQDTHYGEVAPLSTVHVETVADALQLLRALAPHLVGRPLSFDKFAAHQALFGLIGGGMRQFPSVIFGLEQILVSMMRKHDQLQLLGAHHPRTHATIRSAHLLHLTGHQAMLGGAGLSGHTLKFKIGRRGCADEIAQLAIVLRDVDAATTRVRLDANRSFELAEFKEFWRTYRQHIGIMPEFIEEPLRDATHYSQLGGDDLPPLALDETLWDKPIAQQSDVAYYILKPARLGGISATLLAIDYLRARGLVPVLSSCYESALSLQSYGQLAALRGIEQIVMGLGTFGCFATDLLAEGAQFAPGLNQIDLRYGPLTFTPGLLTEVKC